MSNREMNYEEVSLSNPTPSIRRELALHEADLYSELVSQIEEEPIERPEFDAEQEITGMAIKAATLIGEKGATTWEAVRCTLGILRGGNTEEESYWYQIGEKSWKSFCAKLVELVHRNYPNRPFSATYLPEW